MGKNKEKIYQLVNDELINVLVEMSQIAENHKDESNLNENIIDRGECTLSLIARLPF